MKQVKIVLITGFILIIFFHIVSMRIPAKYAVKIEDIGDYPNAILVKEAWHTGTGWEKLGDSTGYFLAEDRVDVHLTGDIPITASIGGDHVNTYLCIVNSTGTWTIAGISFDQYEVLEWYPIYPVQRDTLLPHFFYPDNYISYYEMMNRK